MDTFTKLLLHAPLSEPVFDRLATAANRAELSRNPYLTERQWRTLWQPKLPAAVATALVARPLSGGLVDEVLATEHRSTVLTALASANELTPDQQATVVANGPTGTFAAMLMQLPEVTDESLVAAAALLDGVDRLDWCVHNPSVDLDDLVEAIDGVDARRTDGWRRSMLITKAVHTRPELIDALFARPELPTAAAVALAGCRFVTDLDHQVRLAAHDSEYVALALAANPVVHDEVLDRFTVDSYKVRHAVEQRRRRNVPRVDRDYEAVDRDDQLAWLLRRALPSDYKPAGRPYDLVALAMNPNLDEQTARRVFDQLGDTNLVGAAETTKAEAHLAERLGLPTPPPRVDAGFWVAKTERYVTHHTDRWRLDPDQRPWTDTQLRDAVAGIEPRLLEQVRSSKLASIEYLDRGAVHAVTFAELGDDPARIELATNLAAGHLGDFAGLLAAARKLAR